MNRQPFTMNLDYLKSSGLVEVVSLSEFRNQRMAFDTQRLFELILENSSCYESCLIGGIPSTVVSVFDSLLSALKDHSIFPVFVFPGVPTSVFAHYNNKKRPDQEPELIDAYADMYRGRHDYLNFNKLSFTSVEPYLFKLLEDRQVDFFRASNRIAPQQVAMYYQDFVHHVFGQPYLATYCEYVLVDYNPSNQMIGRISQSKIAHFYSIDPKKLLTFNLVTSVFRTSSRGHVDFSRLLNGTISIEQFLDDYSLIQEYRKLKKEWVMDAPVFDCSLFVKPGQNDRVISNLGRIIPRELCDGESSFRPMFFDLIYVLVAFNLIPDLNLLHAFNPVSNKLVVPAPEIPSSYYDNFLENHKETMFLSYGLLKNAFKNPETTYFEGVSYQFCSMPMQRTFNTDISVIGINPESITNQILYSLANSYHKSGENFRLPRIFELVSWYYKTNSSAVDSTKTCKISLTQEQLDTLKFWKLVWDNYLLLINFLLPSDNGLHTVSIYGHNYILLTNEEPNWEFTLIIAHELINKNGFSQEAPYLYKRNNLVENFPYPPYSADLNLLTQMFCLLQNDIQTPLSTDYYTFPADITSRAFTFVLNSLGKTIKSLLISILMRFKVVSTVPNSVIFNLAVKISEINLNFDGTMGHVVASWARNQVSPTEMSKVFEKVPNLIENFRIGTKLSTKICLFLSNLVTKWPDMPANLMEICNQFNNCRPIIKKLGVDLPKMI
ncbi:hypothetical protein RCL1_007794 [Eukaryota sp. TZLM3-RCL]